MQKTDLPLDRSPDRPTRLLSDPPATVRVVVDVDVAHLGNPLLAVQRLLASEAQAYARATGDDEHILITLALPDDTDDQRRLGLQWISWAVHNAGIRGRVTPVDERTTS